MITKRKMIKTAIENCRHEKKQLIHGNMLVGDSTPAPVDMKTNTCTENKPCEKIQSIQCDIKGVISKKNVTKVFDKRITMLK